MRHWKPFLCKDQSMSNRMRGQQLFLCKSYGRRKFGPIWNGYRSFWRRPICIIVCIFGKYLWPFIIMQNMWVMLCFSNILGGVKKPNSKEMIWAVFVFLCFLPIFGHAKLKNIAKFEKMANFPTLLVLISAKYDNHEISHTQMKDKPKNI